MTDKITTEYLKKIEGIQLSSSVKARMRDELSSFADFHAVDVSAVSKGPSLLHFYFGSKQLAVAFAVVLLVAGGSVSLKAQTALPNDILYPVKIGINESVQSTLATDADAQALLQNTFFNRRLEEVRTLVLQGQKDVASSEEVRVRIDEQREKTLAVASVASQETENKVRAEVATKFLATQRILSSQRNTLALATRSNSPSQMPSQSRMLATSDAIGGAMEGGADATSMAFDAKMAGVESVYSVDTNIFERIARLREALVQTTDIPDEVRSAIESDLDNAVSLLGTAFDADAITLIEYIESFLGVSTSGQTEPVGDVVNMDIPVRSEPLILPIGIDSGFGVSGNSGSGVEDMPNEPLMYEDVNVVEPYGGSMPEVSQPMPISTYISE